MAAVSSLNRISLTGAMTWGTLKKPVSGGLKGDEPPLNGWTQLSESSKPDRSPKGERRVTRK